MYVLLKGTLTNFLVSLKDYKERKSSLIRRYPQGSFIWGLNKSTSLLKKGTKAFLYLNKSESFSGGVVLEGDILDFAELTEKYWPVGEWKYYVALKVLLIPETIYSTEDINSWSLIKLDKLKELGIKVLPGIQKIDDNLGEKLEKALSELNAKRN